MLLEYQKEFLNEYMCEDIVREMDDYVINQTVNGIKEGLWKEYHAYANGQLKYEKFYKDGKEEGIQKGWHENGKLKYEQFYKDGRNEGIVKQWYDNGQLSYEGHYRNGYNKGIKKFWKRNGQLFYEDFVDYDL